MGERWPQRLLVWAWRGALLEAWIARCAYFVRGERCEEIAWGELRDLDGRRRVDIGSFASVALARAACERDAVARCRREREERGPVDVRIARARRPRPGKADKGRELPGGNYRPRDAGEALDAALAAFADVVADEGRDEIANRLEVTVGSLQATCSKLGISLRKGSLAKGNGAIQPLGVIQRSVEHIHQGDDPTQAQFQLLMNPKQAGGV